MPFSSRERQSSWVQPRSLMSLQKFPFPGLTVGLDDLRGIFQIILGV